MTRHVGAHEIVNGDERIEMGIVDIDGGKVSGVRRLNGEEPSTEWLGGTIELRKDSDGILRAYKNERILK